jgi:hypothetical protein
MDEARYHRDQAEHCLQMARHVSDPLAASLTRAAAARHFARALELDKTEANKAPTTNFSDSFYYRAIRTGIGQALRSQLVSLEPPTQELLNALLALDRSEEGSKKEGCEQDVRRLPSDR